MVYKFFNQKSSGSSIENEIILTLIWVKWGGGGEFYTLPALPCSFFCQNSKSCNPGILQHLVTFYYIKDICFKFSICNLPQSPDIGRNWDRGISDFRISGQSFLKENWHNSRTRNDIDMKLGPVTKLEKRNKTMSKNLTVRSCWQMVTSLSFFQFMANMEQSRSWIQDA